MVEWRKQLASLQAFPSLFLHAASYIISHFPFKRSLPWKLLQGIITVNLILPTQVETEKDDIPEEHNTFIEFDVHAYHSPSKTFLYVRAIRVRAQV